jgi:hypothetical protein
MELFALGHEVFHLQDRESYTSTEEATWQNQELTRRADSHNIQSKRHGRIYRAEHMAERLANGAYGLSYLDRMRRLLNELISTHWDPKIWYPSLLVYAIFGLLL